MASKQRAYRKEIDGLRALAVLPVILFHAGFESFSGGFVGVDVFFVISGYLITNLIVEAQMKARFSLVSFYERRARRILPALFFVITVCLPASWYLLNPTEMKSFAKSLLAVCVFSSNFHFLSENSYFATTAELKPLLHTWSLAVEEQYYFLFPLLLLFLSHRTSKQRFWVIFGLLAASFVLSEWTSRAYPFEGFFLLPTRGWEILMGALGALAFRQDKLFERCPQGLKVFAPYVGCAMIVGAVFIFNENTPFPGSLALFPTLGTLLVLLFANHEQGLGKLLSCKVFVGVGLTSYSAYLWHQPLFAFYRYLSADTPRVRDYLLLMGLTFFLAWFTWKFVESPFRDRNRTSTNHLLVLCCLGNIFFLGFGWAALATGGFRRERLNLEQLKLSSMAVPSPKRDSCHEGRKDFRKARDSCVYFFHESEWAVLGDSHSVELAYSLAQVLKPRQMGVHHLSFSNCPPTLLEEVNGKKFQENNRSCARWTQEAMEYFVQESSIKNVLISYRIQKWLFGDHEKSYPEFPHKVSEDFRTLRWKSLIAIFEKLLSAGKRVVWVLQAPELPKSIGDLIFQGKNLQEDLAGVSREWWDERSRFVREHLREVPAGIKIIDPATIFCDSSRCYATKKGAALYFDDDHMSVYGSSLIAARVLDGG